MEIGSHCTWPVALLLLASITLSGCGELVPAAKTPPAPKDRFAPYERDFASVPAGKIHVRGLKERQGAPVHRSAELLSGMYFPEADDRWFYSAHEIATSEPGTVRIEVGDRIWPGGGEAAPLASETSTAPALLLSLRRKLAAPEVLVVLCGHQRHRGGHRLRLVFVGGKGDPTTEGGTVDVEPIGAGKPASVVILDREVPAQHAPSHRSGTTYALKNADWSNYGTYAIAARPVDGSFHLSSWIDLHTEGDTTHAVNNEVTTFTSGDIRIRSEGLSHSFEIGGKPVDSSKYEHALWACRIRFEPPKAR